MLGSIILSSVVREAVKLKIRAVDRGVRVADACVLAIRHITARGAIFPEDTACARGAALNKEKTKK